MTEDNTEFMKELILKQAVDIQALEAEKEELRQHVIKLSGFVKDNVITYQKLWDAYQFSQEVIEALKTGDTSKLGDPRAKH